jgi:two-component system OmpR family sensor kinase
LADAMRRIEQEAGRMHDLVEDLLLLAKLDEGRPLQQRPVRLDQIAADAVRDAQAVEPLRSITCQAEPVEIIGDDARMRQALANLLANARAHTPANASVEVTLRREGQSAVIEVADQGPGMTPEVADRVFERFFRADPARTRASGGSGLGLAIVASITQAHRGTAEVDSEPGAGARFRLRLPLHATPAHVVPDTHVRTMMDP